MMTTLFLTRDTLLEKVAGSDSPSVLPTNMDIGTTAKPVPEDQQLWPEFIDTQLRQALPVLGLYETSIEFLGVDDETRTAFGRVRVWARRQQATQDGAAGIGPMSGYGTSVIPGEENPATTSLGGRLETGGDRHVDIPFIIDHGNLDPLDLVVIDGKVWPLTVQRLKRGLFRPEVGDDLGRPEEPAGMSTDVGPYGLQQGLAYTPGLSGVHLTKSGSLLQRVASASPEVAEKLAARLEADPALLKLAQVTPGLKSTMEKVAQVTPSQAPNPFRRYLGPDGLEKLAQDVVPDATAFWYEDGQYIMKTAAAEAYRPVEFVFKNRGEALKAVPEELVKRADAGEVVATSAQPVATVVDSDSPVSGAVDPRPPVDAVTTEGVYDVPTVDAGTIRMACWPQVVSLDGRRRVSMVVGSTGTLGFVSSAQQLVATRVGDIGPEALPAARPRVGSYGFWVLTNAAGEQIATEPVTILGEYNKMGQVTYSVGDLMGRNWLVSPVAAVKKMWPTGQRVLLPTSACWVPVTKQVHLTTSPVVDPGVDRVVLKLVKPYKVSLEGPPVDALPTKEVELGRELRFVLALLGVPSDDIAQVERALEGDDNRPRTRFNAALGKVVTIHGCRRIKLFEPEARKYLQELEAVDKAARAAGVDLVKEAAQMVDPDSVDALLSLNYVNGETLHEFVAALPMLESTLSRLSELLLATRLGQSDVSEAAVGRAVHALDKVIDDLSRLKYVQVL